VVRSYLIDTSVLIDIEIADLGPYADATGLVSAISIGELAFGLERGSTEQRAARARLLRDVLIHHEVLPFDVEEAKLYGVLADMVRATGRNPRPRRLDLQIAATAAMARLPLLTCNPDDFVGADRLVEVVPVARAG
jgi:predicted nucleic acid-binding protein